MNKVNKAVGIKKTINKRISILSFIVCFSFLIILIFTSRIIIFEHDYYSVKLSKMTSNVYESKTAPRGRIYDRNHKLLVDNKKVAALYYFKPNKITESEEVKLARDISTIVSLDISKVNERMMKDYYLVTNSRDAMKLITDEEWEKYENRKLSSDDIYRLKLSRITEDELDKYTDDDKKVIYIYYLMNNGYFYEEKLIKKGDISDSELANISEALNSLNGFYIKYDFERVYPYGDTFRSILGNVSSISKEDKDYYLNLGYSLNDEVGVSYIEKQYEEYLKGVKSTYKIEDGEIVTLTKGQRGNDIVLTIDIELQQEIDKIIKSELIKAKKDPGTSRFNSVYAVIKEPSTGEILAMTGLEIFKNGDEYDFRDVTVGTLTNPFTPGSVVKGASMLTGFKEGAIEIGEVMKDECIKIYSKPKKCSWKSLGKIDDITALSLSSNVYQFKTAMKLAGFNYHYNAKFDTSIENTFSKYRKVFNDLGLGVKTEIDLPVDGVGNIGLSKDPDLLLNYVIGQYDTYTTMQLSEYISTIATSGVRYKPHLLKEVYASNSDAPFENLIYKTEPIVLNTLDIKKEYMDRVRLGFREVVTTGLGKNYMRGVEGAAGKTGTSESFLDTDGDGVIDTPTISNAFVGFYPLNNPKMSIALTYPNIVSSNEDDTRSYANIRITRLVTNKFFEMYG